MKPHLSRQRCSGFTLIEAAIAMALLGIIMVKLTMVVREASRSHSTESTSMALEDQVRLVLDRISYAVIGSDPATLFPDPTAPFFSKEIKYQISLGVENGVPVWSDLELIGIDDADSSVLRWVTNEGQVEERAVVWARTVSEFLEQELENGIDDNMNGLMDETGLSFTLERDAVTIRLTLERVSSEGVALQHTQETTVTCRNRG